MNGLTLRINPGGSAKMKNTIGFAPVSFDLCENIGSDNKLFNTFLSATAADEQLDIIKKILDGNKKDYASDVIKFLSLVFLHAEVKHPVKCFLVRHVTRSDYLQQSFAGELSQYIKLYATDDHPNYQSYVKVVSKIAPCMENFPAGAAAIKLVEVELAVYLKNCLECCVNTLKEVKTLSPTEKNEIFNLSHLALRLLLYIVQKVNEENIVQITPLFEELRLFIKYLLFDEDTPMDTKTLSGIMYLTIEIIESGKESWIKILDPSKADSFLNSLLVNEAACLSLHSAISTVVPVDRLQAHNIGNTPTLIYLTDCIIAIGERSSESVFSLCVARSIVHISKMLERLPPAAAAALAERLQGFAWAHLEHYMDSVRHLAAQALANVARCAAALDKNGSPAALRGLVSSLRRQPRARKSYYVGVCALAGPLGARRLMALLPPLVADLTAALPVQAVQAAATTALETLLQKHARESNSEELYSAWVLPVLQHAAAHALDSAVLSILENLLATAVALDENIIGYILPHIKESCAGPRGNLKCALMLLHVSRKSGALDARRDGLGMWKDSISYAVLRAAAVDAVEETRILSLSLAVESRRSTEPFSRGELDLVLHYLRYNINAQSPNFRQLTLSILKKFMKRFGDSYAVLARRQDPAGASAAEHYPRFMGRLRAQCFASLLPAANYSRRAVALQALAWAQALPLPRQGIWPDEYVEKLLFHLEDSYENNKALALQILLHCPGELLQNKKYRISLELGDVLRQAEAAAPAACAAAAYKLELLLRMRKEHVLAHAPLSSVRCESVHFALLRLLLSRLQAQRVRCGGAVAAAARHAPMYPLLHCSRHVMGLVDASAISGDEQWRLLVEELVAACIAVSGVVACAVSDAAPEGWLPGETHGVSAQGVLLCAWRCVKEVSLLLGCITSRLTIEGECGGAGGGGGSGGGGAAGGGGTVSRRLLAAAGRHFTTLLSRTKHRGAFEQAYVGFSQLLARLWRCRNCALHLWPRRWLRRLLARLATPRAEATRRSAGLPFMIQALVTTELQVQGNPKCLHECMDTLLKLARATSLPPACEHIDETCDDDFDYDLQSDEFSLDNLVGNPSYNNVNSDSQKLKEENKAVTANVEVQNSSVTELNGARINNSNEDSMTCERLSEDSLIECRTHSVNILRALFRNSVLEESMAGYVGDGLMVALEGFDGDTWMERNSSTLLFSALVARVFGARARQRMTGRIFFLRYPQLYDYMRLKLHTAASTITSRLSPSLYPTLVLLGRLYPSALEGAASALRLAALVPQALACAQSQGLGTRRLAAAAVLPLIAPDQYIPHLEAMLALISSPTVPTNHCHGILLQITKLLPARPDELAVAEDARRRIASSLRHTSWLLARPAHKPCYMLLDEYVKMIDLVIWKFPSFIDDGMLSTIQDYLDRILFSDAKPLITSGRDVCLANVMYLYIVILNKRNRTEDITQLIYKGFEHSSYEVVLSTLNYLLILYNSLEIDSSQESLFESHLTTLHNEKLLSSLNGNEVYLNKLCNIVKSNRYMECIQKTLKVLSLEKDTQKYIVAIKLGRNVESDEEIIRTIFDCIHNEHENLTHIYLESLSKFVTGKLKGCTLNDDLVLDVVRVMFACCSSENNDGTRAVATGFLERNLHTLLQSSFDTLSEKQKFALRGTLVCAAAVMLEDDHPALRQRAAAAVTAATSDADAPASVIASYAAEALRDMVASGGASGSGCGGGSGSAALLALLALLDFKAEVCLTDESSDEGRVFDQNERYNIFLEESVWTSECADKIVELCARADALQYVLSIVDNPIYSDTFHKLCNNNLVLFKRMVNDKSVIYENDVLNPKIELFINKLSVQ